MLLHWWAECAHGATEADGRRSKWEHVGQQRAGAHEGGGMGEAHAKWGGSHQTVPVQAWVHCHAKGGWVLQQVVLMRELPLPAAWRRAIAGHGHLCVLEKP